MEIELFYWDDGNMDKVGLRGFQPLDIDSVLERRFIVLRNKRRRAGTHRIVGRTRNGQLITIVVRPHDSPGVWKPVNAWPSDSEERTHARQAGV